MNWRDHKKGWVNGCIDSHGQAVATIEIEAHHGKTLNGKRWRWNIHAQDFSPLAPRTIQEANNRIEMLHLNEDEHFAVWLRQRKHSSHHRIQMNPTDQLCQKPALQIPPFDPGKLAPKTRFDWWSWSPHYPYWSRSCWGGGTEEEARKAFAKAHGSMDYYANKLVKEERGAFTVIDEIAPSSTQFWSDSFGGEDFLTKAVTDMGAASRAGLINAGANETPLCSIALHAITCIHHTDTERASLPVHGNCPICAQRDLARVTRERDEASHKIVSLRADINGHEDWQFNALKERNAIKTQVAELQGRLTLVNIERNELRLTKETLQTLLDAGVSEGQEVEAALPSGDTGTWKQRVMIGIDALKAENEALKRMNEIEKQSYMHARSVREEKISRLTKERDEAREGLSSICAAKESE